MKKIIVGLLYVLLLGCTHARLPFTTTTDSYSSWRDSTGVPLHAVYGTVGYKIDETAYASWLHRTYAGLRYHPDSLGVIPVYYFIPDSIELTVSCNKMVSDINRLDSVQLVHLFQHHFTGNFPIYSGEDDIGYYLWAMDTLKDQIRCLVLEHFGVCGHGDQIIYLEYSSDGTLQHMADHVACAYASPYNEAYCNAVWNGHTWGAHRT